VRCGEIFTARKVTARFCSVQCYVRRGSNPTYIEDAVYTALDEIGIKHMRQKRIGRWIADALLKSQKIVVECQGDFFHCNPVIYAEGPIHDIQVNQIERDKRKRAYLEREGYRVIEFWESDIKAVGAKQLLEAALSC
jgi:very-short-patch-repair endonuclease